MITALELANAFIDLHGQDGHITNMKLNKLVYFAYAKNLKSGRRVFNDEIQAWKYGPVIPTVYRAYKDYANASIHRTGMAPASDEALTIARDTWSDFGRLGAWDLMKLSHSQDGAWSKVYVKDGNVPIDDETIMASADGDRPRYDGTMADAAEKSFTSLDGVLRMLVNS